MVFRYRGQGEKQKGKEREERRKKSFRALREVMCFSLKKKIISFVGGRERERREKGRAS